MVNTSALVLHADHDPMPGVDHPGPHQVFRHPHLEVVERELSPVAPGTVRVEMILAGICGTDLHAVQSDPESGYILGSSPLDVGPAGRILGHEGVGRVVEVGNGVDDLRPGAIVTFESIIHCHRCDPCRRGDFNQCERAKLLGMERDGLFAHQVDIPGFLCHDVSDLRSLPRGLEAAACVEPAACSYVACSLTRIVAGESVVIFGAGPIGLFTAMLCQKAFGAGTIHVVEPREARRALASRWCDRTYGVEEFFADPPPASIDVAIEASGVLGNVTQVLPMLGRNARVALLARSGEPLSVDVVDHLITNNIAIYGSRGNLGGAFSRILRLIRLQRLPLQDAVTQVVEGIEELAKWLEDPILVPEENCKVLASIDSVPTNAGS